MDLAPSPYTALDWDALPETVAPGLAGEVRTREARLGPLRVRRVAYGPGYVADHWCRKGHVVLVLEGELTSELEDGRTSVLRAGQGYLVGDGSEAHRSRTEGGAVLFIVD